MKKKYDCKRIPLNIGWILRRTNTVMLYGDFPVKAQVPTRALFQAQAGT